MAAPGGGGGNPGGGGNGNGGAGAAAKLTLKGRPTSRRGVITFAALAPAAGLLTAAATRSITARSPSGKRRTRTVGYGSVTRTIAKAGAVAVSLKPTAAARRALRKAHRLTLKATLTVRP